MAVLLSIYSDRMNLMNSSTYFFLLIPLGLIASGFLFGALRSHARYSGQAYGGTLELGGPVIVLILVIYLGYKFRPSETSFSVTMNVFEAGTSNQPIDKGNLLIYYGTAHLSKKISDGQVVISEIPKTYRGAELKVIPQIEGYSPAMQTMSIPADQSPITVSVEKIIDSVTISGIVMNENGTVVKNAMVIIADGLAKDSTDGYGNFHITLPLKDGTETRLRVYLGNRLRYNSLVILSGESPLSIQLTSS
jgi:hypothetical protein